MSWINHLPPACWSTFRKSNSKQQLGCRFDIMDYESYFFVFWHMQLYMSWYIISFFGFTFLNIFIFSSTLVLTFSYRRNLYTFYSSSTCIYTCMYIYINIQIKICAEYRDMLPRPRLVCQKPGLRPIGRSPGVPDKSSRGLGSMSRYSAQILICFIAYIFLIFFSFLCGFGWELCRTASISGRHRAAGDVRWVKILWVRSRK